MVRSMICREGDKRDAATSEELGRFHIHFELNRTKFTNEQRLKGSQNSSEKESTEIQHVKAERQSWRGQRIR